MLILLVVLSQILLLKPIIGQGLTTEDYVGFSSIRISKDTMFSNPVNYWVQIGIHDAAHNLYLGFQDILFGENYTMYLYFDIFFKVVATLLLYPLIIIISKNKLLAFLGTFIYSISYSTAGALYLYVVGNEYLGVALFYIFLITYYFCIRQTNFWSLLLSSLTMTLSFLVLPIRIFPVFAIIPLIEVFILIKSKLSKFTPFLLRIVALFLPIAIIMLFSLKNSGTGAYDFESLPIFLKRITDGNWYLLLYPLWGFGYTYLPVAYFHIFGVIDISNYFTFIESLFRAPVIIFSAVSLFLAFFISKKHISFFFTVMLIDLFLNTVLFILYTHHFSIPRNLVHGYSHPSFTAGLYSNILANFVISIAIACGIEWFLTGRKSNLLFFVFVSPFFSLFFIVCQWFFTRNYYMYQEGIHRYFVIPAIGSYLFLAGILTLIYQRKKLNQRFFASVLIIFIIFQIFNISKAEIAQVFYGKKGSGRDLQIQQSMQSQTLSYIPRNKLRNDMLFYIKLKSDIIGDANRWEDTFDWRNLTFWMPIKKSYLLDEAIEGCTAMTIDYSELQKMAKVQNGSKGFLYKKGGNKEARCAHKGYTRFLDEYFIKVDDFYAFAISKDLKVINITDEVKNSLIFRGQQL